MGRLLQLLVHRVHGGLGRIRFAIRWNSKINDSISFQTCWTNVISPDLRFKQHISCVSARCFYQLRHPTLCSADVRRRVNCGTRTCDVACCTDRRRLTDNGDWLSRVWRPTKHIIGHIGDGFLRIKWPKQQCQSTEGWTDRQTAASSQFICACCREYTELWYRLTSCNETWRWPAFSLYMTDSVLFRIAVTVYRCLRGIAPDYLSELCAYRASQSSSFHQPNCLRTAVDVLVYPAQPFGTVCRIIWETLLYLGTYFVAESLIMCMLLTFRDAIAH